MSNGRMRNGHDDRGDEPPKVASLENARRQREERERARKASARAASRGAGMPGAIDRGRSTVGGWIFALAVLAMALGMIAWWVAPLLRAAGVGI